jgi:hypothetical protein
MLLPPHAQSSPSVTLLWVFLEPSGQGRRGGECRYAGSEADPANPALVPRLLARNDFCYGHGAQALPAGLRYLANPT